MKICQERLLLRSLSILKPVARAPLRRTLSTAPPIPSTLPPILSKYSNTSPVYYVGEQVVPNVLSNTGGPATFSVARSGMVNNVGGVVPPPMPAGLVIDPVTGTITGVPVGPAGITTLHRITASNDAGSESASLSILIAEAWLKGRHQPPLAVRTALVGCATALATPLFPVIGLNYFVFRLCLQLPEPLVVTINMGASVMYLTTMLLVPKAFYYAPLLLPIALGNGLTAAATYAALDAAAGGPDALKRWSFLGGWLPLVGPLVGVTTALAAPLTYPATFALTWCPAAPTVTSDPSQAVQPWAWAYDPMVYSMVREAYACGLHEPMMLQGVLCMGFCSGLMLHPSLEIVVAGYEGVAWHSLAGRVLAALTLCLVIVYSTAARTTGGIPHLRSIDCDSLPEQSWLSTLLPWPFSSDRRAACYIGSERDLCWVPALALDDDGDDGEEAAVRVLSQQLHPTRVAPPAGGGTGTAAAQYAYGTEDATASARHPVERGAARAEEAAVLRAKLADPRLHVYGSRHAAFFDGLSCAQPLEPAKAAGMLQGLPVAEALLTDAAALLVAGRAPAHEVARGLRECLPLLATSHAHIQRFSAGYALMRSSWADEVAREEYGSALATLTRELALRRAQLAELWRLDHGAPPGPYTQASLEEELHAAGVHVARARRTLTDLSVGPGASDTSARADDWRAMERAATREWRQGAVRGASVVGATVLMGALIGAGMR